MMTNLIVRPIDDDRYSITSRVLYTMGLIEYGLKQAQAIVDDAKITASLLKPINLFKKGGLVEDRNSVEHDIDYVLDGKPSPKVSANVQKKLDSIRKTVDENGDITIVINNAK